MIILDAIKRKIFYMLFLLLATFLATNARASDDVLEYYNEIVKNCSDGKENFSDNLVKLDEKIRVQVKTKDSSKVEDFFKEGNISSDIYSYFATDLVSDDSDLRGLRACGTHYVNFLKAYKEKSLDKSKEQFDFWESCLMSDYKENVPDVPKKVINCYRASRTPSNQKTKK